MTMIAVPRFLPLRLTLVALLMAPMAAQAAAAGGQGLQRAEEQLRAADKNGDGAVSRAEFTQYRAAQWTRLDRNGDGYFSKADIPSFAQSRWDGERAVELRRQFDRDRDGRISRAEFFGGPTPIFDTADANRDNVVSKTEMQAAAEQLKAR